MDKHNQADQAKLEMQQNQLAVRSHQNPRQGWEEELRLMAERGDDQSLDAHSLPPTQWDVEEWEWDLSTESSDAV